MARYLVEVTSTYLLDVIADSETEAAEMVVNNGYRDRLEHPAIIAWNRRRGAGKMEAYRKLKESGIPTFLITPYIDFDDDDNEIENPVHAISSVEQLPEQPFVEGMLI